MTFLTSSAKQFSTDIFVNEDISKPENRINLALFHLQMIPEFHEWFLNKLKLNVECVIYPIKNIDGCRPDLVVKSYEGIEIGYIEVECGQDLEQLSRFKSQFEKEGKKVYSVFGKKEYNPDVSLEEIKDFIKSIHENFRNHQEKLSALYLIELIESTMNVTSYKRQPVDENFIESNYFLKELLNKMKDIDMPVGINRPAPGYIYRDTTKEKGFSLKVYSGKGAGKYISLLNISGGRPYVNFQSAEKYRDYLNHKPKNSIDQWIDFIVKSMGFPIDTISYRGKLSVPISIVHENIDELIRKIRLLV